MTMVAILTLGLMLRPSAVTARRIANPRAGDPMPQLAHAKGHGAATFRVISPPPDEPPPVPPPSADLLRKYWSDEAAEDFRRSVNLHGFNAKAGCAERVLRPSSAAYVSRPCGLDCAPQTANMAPAILTITMNCGRVTILKMPTHGSTARGMNYRRITTLICKCLQAATL
jgi:hypothetical protein